MMHQTSMFDLLEPKPAPRPYTPPVIRDVRTRAYGVDHIMQCREDEPDPIEIEVRGVPCVVKFGFGFSTYAVQKPGSLFWSETGFRSFAVSINWGDRIDEIPGLIEQYIDAPTKDGNGMGGKLAPWWPRYVNQWREAVSFGLRHDRETMWGQWGPEKQAEHWAAHDARCAAALKRMIAEGIDPSEVGKPKHHKGKWPHFEIEGFTA